jgi:hypothetical protein
MSKARGLADLGNVTTRLDEVGNTDGALSNRNLIINGAMQVAQRGTSFTTTNGYHLDRWRVFNSAGTATISQQEFASGASPEVGIANYVRVVRASPTGLLYIHQRVEDVRKSDSATLTFSFYGKASSPTTVSCRIPQEFGAGGSTGVSNTPQANNLTTVWQKFNVTFNMASLSGKTIGTGSYFDPVFDVPATTATIEITGVQLEYGDTATPFENRSFGQELALCQRYFQMISADTGTGTGTGICNGLAESATQIRGVLPLAASMRSVPTIGVSDPTHFTLYTTASHLFGAGSYFSGTSRDAVYTYGVSTGMTAGHAGQILFNNPAGKIYVDAEL